MLGILHHVVDSGHFLLHQVTQHLVVIVKEVGDNCSRCVTAVSGAEGIVHIYVSIAGQGLGKLGLACLHLLLGGIIVGIILLDTNGLAFLLGVEAQVLEQEHLTGLQLIGLSLGIGTILSKLHRGAQRSGYSTGNLAQ